MILLFLATRILRADAFTRLLPVLHVGFLTGAFGVPGCVRFVYSGRDELIVPVVLCDPVLISTSSLDPMNGVNWTCPARYARVAGEQQRTFGER